MFSPYYAWANARRPADPENFCAMNAVLYRPQGGRWAMTERGAKRLARRDNDLWIGPSGLHWDGARLHAEINERCAPLPRALRGRFTLTPDAIQPETFTLDAAGRHRWRPIAPRARIDVAFDKPGLAWSGTAYFDCNDGDRPLAEDFSSWHWSRGGDRILYDVTRQDGSRHGLALAIGADGRATHVPAPPEIVLPRTGWRLARQTRSEAGARVLKTLEDAPFYARSLVETQLGGAALHCVHESLSLERFKMPVVQMMLPFRMPRRVGLVGRPRAKREAYTNGHYL